MDSQNQVSDGVESLLSRIPGIRTYRQREHRRETDKRIRQHLSARLQEAKGQVKRMISELQKNGRLERLDELDALSSHMQQISDTIRYASYGYRGIFDFEKVREEELDELLAFDSALVGDLDLIISTTEKMRQGVPSDTWSDWIQKVQQLVADFEKRFLKRKDLLSRPL